MCGGEEPGASKMFVYCAVRECEILENDGQDINKDIMKK